MLTEGTENRHRWRLWVTAVLLVFIAALAFMWPDPGVGERVSNAQTPSQDVVWRQCNPTAEALRAQDQPCDIKTQTPAQDVVWRECSPETEAQCTQKQDCDVPTQVPAQAIVWRQCNPTIEAERADAVRWDIPQPTPTVWYTCDCILTQIPTPWATATPIQDTD